MRKRITINPVTRLEGHGKIEIFLNDDGNVDKAYLQIPELKGFEKFCEGRPAEEMPIITSRICGVCPTAHHFASTKALDSLYKVEPPPAAKKIRELMYSVFMVEDHTLDFFFLGGPDFVTGPGAPAAERNILGVIAKVGQKIAGEVLRLRRECREILAIIGGKATYPVCGLPGGISKPLTREDRDKIEQTAKYSVEFGKFALKIFNDIVLSNKDYIDLITGESYKHRTYYMGLVDENDKVNFYDGKIKVVNPDGKDFVKFNGGEYLSHIAEKVEPWTYMKFTYLKNVGWKGLIDGADSGVYRVAPLARLNAASGMATPLAQREYEKMYETLGGKPAHNTLAFHWARLIELLYAAERMLELVKEPDILDTRIRNVIDKTPEEGVGVIEAPRGTLIHHYKTDGNGILEEVNLIVATQNNAAAICMSIQKAAQSLIKNGQVDDGILNMVEMAFRAYDPCFACATHAFPGQTPLVVHVFDSERRLVREIRRD